MEKLEFKSIRNHLAANTVGATRDEVLAQQLINLIFCKLYDEKYTAPDQIVKFRAGIGEKAKEVEQRILALFEEVKTNLPEVIDEEDRISLDTNSIVYVVGELQNYSLVNSERDVVADAFETFIGHALKGGQGQFFTPRNVVCMIIDILQPSETDKIIDPACGSGGFLIDALKFVWEQTEQKYRKLGWKEGDIEKKKINIATKNFRGIDKDYFLSKVAKAYMNLMGDGTTGIFCEDSLELPQNWRTDTQSKIALETFDILLTNPPFGKEMKVVGQKKLQQYTLSYEWKKIGSDFVKTQKLKKEIQPQFLFIERCLDLLKNGGKMAIILPETFFHAPKMHHIIQLFEKHNIIGLIDLAHNTFRPHNNAKCIVLLLQKNTPQQGKIKMAVAVQVGHDHNGKPMYRWDYRTQQLDRNEIWDDIPLIVSEWKKLKKPQYTFEVESTFCKTQKVYVPRYYWNRREQEIEQIAQEKGLQLISIQELMDRKLLKTFDGHGSPPAENKGMGEVPYIRVKDIVNWEVYKDPTALIPTHVFEKMRPAAKCLQAEDVLFVRRGSYRIGSVALVSPYDTEVLLTREILVLRANSKNDLGLTSYYLVYLLSHYLVQMQMYNKVLMETTLPNIANRWTELRLPIHQDPEERKKISQKIEHIFKQKWNAQKEILAIKEEFGNLTT